MRQGLVVGEVVRADNLYLGALRQRGTEEVAADPTEAVDAYANCHSLLLVCAGDARLPAPPADC
jgi:hypothetical protein